MADPTPGTPTAASPTENDSSNTWGTILKVVGGIAVYETAKKFAGDVAKQVVNDNMKGAYDAAVRGASRVLSNPRALATGAAAVATSPEAAVVAGGAVATVPVALGASQIAMQRMNAAANVAIRQQLQAQGVNPGTPGVVRGYTPFLGREFNLDLRAVPGR